MFIGVAAAIIGFGSLCVAGQVERIAVVALVEPLLMAVALAMAARLPTVSVGDGGIVIESPGHTTRVPWAEVVRVVSASFIGPFGRIDRVNQAPIHFFARSDSFELVARYFTPRHIEAKGHATTPYTRASPHDAAGEPLHESGLRGAVIVASLISLVGLAAFVVHLALAAWRSGAMPEPEELAVIPLCLAMALVFKAMSGAKVFASSHGLLVLRGSRARQIAWSEVAQFVPPDALMRHRALVELLDGDCIRFLARRDAISIAARHRELARQHMESTPKLTPV